MEVTLAMALATSEAQAATPVAKPAEGASAPGARAGAPAAEMTPGTPEKPVPPQQRNWVPVIALGAASVVGLGVGIGTTVASNAASGDVDVQGRAILDAGGQCKQPPSAFVDNCSKLYDAGSRQETFGNAARVAYVASGVLVVAAVTYALWPRAEARIAVPVRVLPDVGVHSARIVLLGVW
ncbi:hypothetical protein WME75_03810 [Sorangium sp. So ce1014]|uniref:hypothetical protein n=1 Tax=Sorangium sp. So ce1014 TaxID=3133326 RepID=UPI003F63E23A